MPGDPHTAQLWSASAAKSHDNSFHLNQAIRLTEMVVADYMPALRQPERDGRTSVGGERKLASGTIDEFPKVEFLLGRGYGRHRW